MAGVDRSAAGLIGGRATRTLVATVLAGMLAAYGSATGTALTFPEGPYGVGGPRQPDGVSVSIYLIGTYDADAAIEIVGVEPIETKGSVELLDSWVVDGVVDEPGWGTMTTAEQMARLAELDQPVLSDCAAGCEVTFAVAVRSESETDPASMQGFEIRYEDEDGRRFEQEVDFRLDICPPDRPECSDELDG